MKCNSWYLYNFKFLVLLSLDTSSACKSTEGKALRKQMATEPARESAPLATRLEESHHKRTVRICLWLIGLVVIMTSSR